MDKYDEAVDKFIWEEGIAHDIHRPNICLARFARWYDEHYLQPAIDAAVKEALRCCRNMELDTKEA